MHFLTGNTLNFVDQGASDGNVAIQSYNASTGVLTLTSSGATATLAQWQVALRSITYSFTAGGDPTGGGSDTSRTITWTVNDGLLSSAADTSAITVVHTAPTIVSDGAVTFTGGGSPAVLDSTLVLTVPDSAGNLASATVSIGNFQTADRLSVNGQSSGTVAGTNITVSFNTSTGVLSLTGTDTAAHYKSVLEQVQYSVTANGDPTAGGAQTSRTISWQIKDGSSSNGSSAVDTSSLTTVHTAPTVNTGASAAYFVGGAAVVLDNTVTVSDPNSGGNLTGATVAISSDFVSGDTLNFTNQNGISGSYASGTGILTLSGTTSLANYQAALRSITYSSTAPDATAGNTELSRVISWTVRDGSTSNGTSTTDTSALSVTNGPQIGVGGTVTYNAGDAALHLDASITLTDGAATTLASATVSITSGFLSGDVLAADTTGTSISASYNASTGVLTLTGTDTLAHYETVMESVTYRSTLGDPTSGGTDGNRTITWSANDGSNQGTATSSVQVRTAPSVTAGASVSYTEQGTAAVLDAGLTLSDPDSPTLASATVSITGFVTGDSLNFTNQNGISGSYNSSTGVLTLTGSASRANYQTALNSITFLSTSDNPTNFGASTSRTINWTVNDGALNSTAATSTVTVTPVNDVPVVTAGGTVSFTEQGSAVTLASTLTVSDADNTTLASATVSIGTGFFAGDTLNFSNQNGITGSYDSSTGVLTLSGSATVANYQAALRSVTFSSASDNPTNFGANTSRTISFKANDGTADSTAAISTVSVTAINDRPVVTSGATVSYTEQQTAAVLDSGLTLTDADNTTLASATVSIGSFLAGDTLSFTNQNGISGSYNSSTGVLTLTGSATVANYQTALRSITFFSTSDNPTNFGSNTSRTISWTATDSTLTSTTATSTVNVTAVNDAPVVTAGATVTYTEQAAATQLNATLTLSDADNTTMAGATVSITSGLLAGDTLSFTDQSGISGSYDSSTGVLTLTGSATVANYQAALRSIRFSSASDNPTNFGANPSRTITWSVDDGTNHGQRHQHGERHGGQRRPGGDVGSDGQLHRARYGCRAQLRPDGNRRRQHDDGERHGNDQLGPPRRRQAQLHRPERHRWRLQQQHRRAHADRYRLGSRLPSGAALGHLLLDQRQPDQLRHRYQPHDRLAGERRQRDQQQRHQHGERHGGQRRAGRDRWRDNELYRARDGGSARLRPDAQRPDNTTLASATVSVGTGFLAGDTLNFSNQNGISGSYDSGTGVLTLTGSASVANYQTALRSITFSSTSDNPTSLGTDTSRTVSWQVNDGALDSTAATSTVNVTAVNDAPVVTAGAAVSFTEQGSAVVLNSSLTLSDADNTSLASATVSIGSFVTGDTLNFTDQNGITGSYNSGTGVLTLTGSASIGNYQAALRSITFSSASDNPTNFGASTSRTISWTANDGALNSTAATSTVSVTAVDDAPVVAAGATVSYAAGGTAAVLDTGLTLSDIDNTTLASATVSIGSGFLTGDTLNFTNQNGISGSYDGGTGVLTLTGSASIANYQTALRSITFSSTNVNPTNSGADANRTIAWQVNDGTLASNAASSTLNIDPPVVTAGATVSYTEQGTPAVLDSSLTLSDADNTTLASATVSISAGFLAGDTLVADTTGTSISASYNTATGVLTLSGIDTVADYQAVLRSVTFSSTSDNPTSFATDTSRTITWTANDGALDSTAATSTVNITAVNDAPVVTAGATVGFTEQGSAVVLDSGLTLSDADNTTLTSAAVSIGGFVAGDTLSFTNQNGISGSYDSGTGVLTLTGSASVANYQAALRTITFSSASDNPSNFGANTSRTISFTANDGTVSSTAATSTVNVTAVNDAPVVTAGATVSFTEQGSAVVLDSSLTLSDADNTTLASATVSIGSGFLAGDTLNFTNQNGITGSYDSGTGVLTLSGSASVANYQAALRSITFSSASDNPTSFATDTSRSITWQVNDGALNSTAATSTVNITAVNDAPVVTAGSDGRLHRAGLGRRARCHPDVERRRQHDAGERLGIDRRLRRRRHAELHQPERHHRHLRQQPRHTRSDRYRLGGQLSGGAALDHLLLGQRQPDRLRRQYQPHHQLYGERRRPDQHDRHQHGERHRGERRPGGDRRRDGRLHRAGLGRRARLQPDAERCRQYESGERLGVDRKLRRRRHAELHQPERHHRQLQQRHRRAHAQRQRLGRQLPDGAALDHLLLGQRQPHQLRRQYQPHHQLHGQRRHREQHGRHQHGERHGGKRCPGGDGRRDGQLHRAGLRRRARLQPDPDRCRQHDTGECLGVDRQLRRRRHAELHQPERHLGQLRQRHRRAHADRQRLGRQLPGGAALDHLLLGQRQPDQLRRQHQPHHQLHGQRRRA